MKQIMYETYLDKVYGCWIGKCVAGTIGAPYEGMKQLMELEYDEKLIENMLPNDDLDLQVLWLSVLEQKGVSFTSEDLAEAFVRCCPYWPGEYAIFRKNYDRGIHPPDTGRYDNTYYMEGMGCPIRSEIWACLAPGDPELAAGLSGRDGILDHWGNSIYAERFLAALEAAAFFESDLAELVEIGLAYVPPESRIASLIRDTMQWCRSTPDWMYVRSQLLWKYGHPDCTNLFQNIGVTLLALYYGEMDFIKTTMIALNCGFDTDCTCATVGSILGIISGGKRLMEMHGFKEQHYLLGVHVTRRSDRVYDLAEDTCRMGAYFNKKQAGCTRIEGCPEIPDIREEAPAPVSILVEYEDGPFIGVGDSKGVKLCFSNHTGAVIAGSCRLEVPDQWEWKVCGSDLSNDTSSEIRLVLEPDGQAAKELVFTIPHTVKRINEKNIVGVRFESEELGSFNYSFGLIGASAWKVYGPFWENHVTIPPLKTGESYYAHIPAGDSEQETTDRVRNYHLNTYADIDKEYISAEEMDDRSPGSRVFEKEGRWVNIYGDRFSVNDLFGFQGPCVAYMQRRIECPEDRTVFVQIGHTDAFQLWVNGLLVTERDNVDWWTAENVHVSGLSLKKGENRIVVRLTRRSARADFSMIFSKGPTCAEHYADSVSILY